MLVSATSNDVVFLVWKFIHAANHLSGTTLDILKQLFICFEKRDPHWHSDLQTWSYKCFFYNFIKTFDCQLKMVLFMIPRDLFAEDEINLAWLLYFNLWSTIAPRSLSLETAEQKGSYLEGNTYDAYCVCQMDDMAFVNIKSKVSHVGPSS